MLILFHQTFSIVKISTQIQVLFHHLILHHHQLKSRQMHDVKIKINDFVIVVVFVFNYLIFV